MKKVLCSALCILLTASLMSAAEQKKRVAVLNFDFGAVHNWWGGQWDIGKGIADLVVDQLVNDGEPTVSLSESNWTPFLQNRTFPTATELMQARLPRSERSWE
jgi:hypothetical protein